MLDEIQPPAKPVVIFTDLDGTLLDHATYSFGAARPALEIMESLKIPFVICSSKTRAEIARYRRLLNNTHPFISENGGGVFMPKGYFRNVELMFETETSGAYDLIRLGARYDELRAAIKRLRATGFNVRGFGDMAAEEVAGLTGLGIDEAILAKEREFDEPFILTENTDEDKMINEINAMGFRHTKGRFHHIMGQSDKGRAVGIVIDLYKRLLGDEITSVGIGDNQNDIEMLTVVDMPVIVMNERGGYNIETEGIVRAEGIGPVGWNNEMLKILGK